MEKSLGLRKEQKEKTRAGLVSHAEKLFSAKGITSTTTADIAKALKVSHGTLFVHFKTRDDLVAAVVSEFGERLSVALGARCADDLKLKDLLTSHVEVLSEFEDFYLRLVSETFLLPNHIRATVYSMNASISYRMFRACKADMDRGQIKKLSQVHLFNTWMGLLNYYILNRDLFSEKKPILSEQGQELVRHFLNLIKI